MLLSPHHSTRFSLTPARSPIVPKAYIAKEDWYPVYELWFEDEWPDHCGLREFPQELINEYKAVMTAFEALQEKLGDMHDAIMWAK